MCWVCAVRLVIAICLTVAVLMQGHSYPGNEKDSGTTAVPEATCEISANLVTSVHKILVGST